MGKRVGGGKERAGDHNAERDLVSDTGSPAEHGWTRGKAAPEGLPPARQTFEAPRRKRRLQGDSFTREHNTDHGKRPVTRRRERGQSAGRADRTGLTYRLTRTVGSSPRVESYEKAAGLAGWRLELTTDLAGRAGAPRLIDSAVNKWRIGIWNKVSRLTILLEVTTISRGNIVCRGCEGISRGPSCLGARRKESRFKFLES
jgi:hypothetical protein